MESGVTALRGNEFCVTALVENKMESVATSSTENELRVTARGEGE